MDNQNKPQDNQKVEKSAEIFLKSLEISSDWIVYVGAKWWKASEFLDLYADPLKSRIAELERNEQSDAKHIASLEKQLKQYQQIIDFHILSSANYSPDYINKVLAQNAVYREALEGIVSTSCKVTLFGSSAAYREAYQIAEQALNPKDNG